jgi:hypothetical protein
VPFVPENARAAPAPLDQFDPDPAAGEPRAAAAGDVEGYSIWPTLLPTYWMPRLREPVEAVETVAGGVFLPRKELLGWGFGAETSGFDLVRRHAYAAYLQAFTSGSEVEGGFAYSWRGLGNPVLGLRAEQLWSSGGQFLSQLSGSRDTVFVLERTRIVDATLGLVSEGWRRTLSLTFAGGLVWKTRAALASDLGPSPYTLSDVGSRYAEGRVSVAYSTVRSFSFQTGGTRGLSAAVMARSRRELGLAQAEVGFIGADGTFADITGRARAYLPLWSGGHARHVLAVQLAGGSAWGPGAQRGHFGAGGASGTTESLTWLELFGGSYVFLPVRGYPTYARYGRFAWAASAEYRFPIALLNRGVGAWPLHFDRVVGSVFFDVGDAWSPYPRLGAIASAGAEVTVGLLAWFNTATLLRGGVAVPWSGGDPQVYVRVGLPF